MCLFPSFFYILSGTHLEIFLQCESKFIESMPMEVSGQGPMENIIRCVKDKIAGQANEHILGNDPYSSFLNIFLVIEHCEVVQHRGLLG